MYQKHNGKSMFRYGKMWRTHEEALEDMYDSFNGGDISNADSPAILPVKNLQGEKRYALYLEAR